MHERDRVSNKCWSRLRVSVWLRACGRARKRFERVSFRARLRDANFHLVYI